MKVFQKRTLSLLLAVLMLVSMVSVAGLASAQSASALSGTITISLPMELSKPVWDALAADYMARNPGVTVVVDNKETTTYAEWLGTQLAGGDMTADIVINNTAIAYFAQGKFADYSLYLNRPNPYMGGEPWMNGLEPEAYAINVFNGIFTICTDSTQVVWFYNKDIFAKAGVEPPTTWDELVDVCKKIKDAGYTPFSIAGDANSINAHLGWLQWIYVDQYFRDMEPLALVKDGDYNYDPDLMTAWTFDPTDRYNDSATKVAFNSIRVLRMILDGEVGPDTAKYKDMFQNFKKIIPEYVEEGFFGTDFLTAQNIFLQGKAAILLNTTSFAGSFDKLMEAASATETFDLGFFKSPPMTGDLVGVDYTREIGGQVGFVGVINKDKAQNDLNMDFMMYYLSPDGQAVRYQAMLDNGLAPEGTSLVKNAVMPDKWRELFAALKYDGAHPASNPFYVFSSGLDAESTRAFQDYSQQYFQGTITVDEFASLYQAALVASVPRYLTMMGMNATATDDPSKSPLP